ncbi:glutamine-hydrolyzing carbamoyl-phosphate synthase small subunit [Candidatus Vidania fulgoroideorum]
MHIKKSKCILELIDGSKFTARSYGFKNNFFGEIVFNTSNLGYQEIFSDPSYLNKILVFSSSNIGNTGINLYDNESCRIWLSAIIVKNLSVFYSNFNSKISIKSFLKKNKIIVLEIKDTRQIILKIRKMKKNNAFIYFKKKKKINKKFTNITTKKNFLWNEKNNFLKKKNNNEFFNKLLIFDFGIKFNILRCLSKKNFLLVINSKKKINLFKININAVVFSNGPGNPNDFKNINFIRKIIKKKIPILGICLGHQLISLSLKMKVKKMKVGHHGINHPVLFKNSTIITSQNHDYEVINKNKNFSLFDKSNQGIFNNKKKIITFQGHPEHSPGTFDALIIFKHFYNFLKCTKKKY